MGEQKWIMAMYDYLKTIVYDEFFVLSFKDDEDGDEAEEESEGGEQDDEMDAQQGQGSPGNGAGVNGALA
jgi:hypothetical protein